MSAAPGADGTPTALDATAWPLVGRDEERSAALGILVDGPRHGVVLAGAAGVGKSRLAAAVAADLPPGWHVEAVAATSTSPPIPFAPFAHLLDGAGTDPVGARLEPPDLLWTLRLLRRRLLEVAGADHLLVAVDDAHALDEPSATLLHQLAATGEARLLLTVRSGAPAPATVVGLWKDGLCDLLELQPLSATETARLAADACGAWFDQASVTRLHAASGGNPLLLREVLADAVAGGRLVPIHDLLRWDGVAGTPRLEAVVATALGRLRPEQAEAVDLLAVGEPLPVAAARTLIPVEVLAALEQAGVVRSDQPEDGRLRLAHPLYGEVRRAGIGPLRRVALQQRLAEAVAASGPLGAEEHLRVLRWRLDGAEPVPARDLTVGAHDARRLGDAELAEALARAALDAGAGPDVGLLLAEVLEAVGRPAEAVAALAGLLPRLDDDAQRARALVVEIRCRAHALGRPAEAERAVEQVEDIDDPTWRGFALAQWATTLSMFGRLDEARALAQALLAAPDDRVRLRALPAANLAALAAGRLDDALAAAEALVGPALAHRDEVPAGVAVVFSALCLDLAQLGRYRQLDELLELVAGDPSSSLPANRAYVRMVEGDLALRRGRVDDARRALAECVGLFAVADPQGYRPAAAARWAEASAAAGDRITAHRAALECRELIAARPARLIDLDSERSLAWVAVADGDPTRARRHLEALAQRARSAGYPTFELAALHDAVRLGAGARTARRLVGVAGQVDGERAAAVRAHGDAVLDGSGTALEAAAHGFEALGELLVAAEVGAAAARALAREGRHPAARRAAARASGLLARCSGAEDRLGLAAVDVPDELTPRELQVARLAARGASSRAIADELGVSPRTVDNLLGRTYLKLGIGGRQDLADRLDALPATPPG